VEPREGFTTSAVVDLAHLVLFDLEGSALSKYIDQHRCNLGLRSLRFVRAPGIQVKPTRRQLDTSCWTADAVRALGLTTDIETAGQILGIGRTKTYEMARNNQFPVRVFRVGNRYRIAAQAILELLRHGMASAQEPGQV
jgi:hypothetical protein